MPVYSKRSPDYLGKKIDAIVLELLLCCILRIGNTEINFKFRLPFYSRQDMDRIDYYSFFFHARLVYKSWIPCRLISIAHATTRCLDTQNVTTEDKELIDCKPRMDRIYFVPVIKDSSHRDGAIYKNKFIREDFWEGDIADRNESKWSKMTKSLSSNLYAYCRMSFFCKYIFMCTDLFFWHHGGGRSS